MSKPIGLSRGTGIDMDKCVESAGGNRFDLVLIASAKSREIHRQNVGSNKREHVHSIVTALEDIQAGKVNPKVYLAKVK
jgi:DNA-directed RNA polymerase omega subunit